MTRNEQEYNKMLKKMEELQKKLDDKKEELEKERDMIVVKAMQESHITREEGAKLAKLIGDERMFAKIMAMAPEVEERIVKKRRDKHEDEEENMQAKGEML